MAKDIFAELRNLRELVSTLCDDAFGAGVQGAINWADLECVEASFCININGELGYRVLIEEAAPEEIALHEFILQGLEAYGFDVTRLTIETAW